MNVKVVVVLVAGLAGLGASAPAGGRGAARAQPAPGAATDRIAEAYDEFLLAQRAEDDDDTDGAVAAYRQAMSLDPQSAEIVAALRRIYVHAAEPRGGCDDDGGERAQDRRKQYRSAPGARHDLRLSAGPGGHACVPGRTQRRAAEPAKGHSASGGVHRRSGRCARRQHARHAVAPVCDQRQLRQSDCDALGSDQAGARVGRRFPALGGRVCAGGPVRRGGELSRAGGGRGSATVWHARRLLRARAAMEGCRGGVRAGVAGCAT